MPSIDTKLFGVLSYEEDQVIRLRSGLPGLPGSTELLPVSQTTIEPFLFFQALGDPSLALLAVPVAVAKNDFPLSLSQDQRQEIDWGSGSGRIARDETEVGVFALVSVGEDRIPTANLLAPLVICFRNNLAVQAIQPVDESFLRYPIEASVAPDGMDDALGNAAPEGPC